MVVLAIVSLGRNAEQEAPLLAADLGLTVYETAIMLRGAKPVIVLRTEDLTRAIDIAGRVRGRGHDAVLLDLAQVTWSDAMFRPKTFHFEGDELVGQGGGQERRLPFADVFALVRAVHTTENSETVTTSVTAPSLGRAAMTGGIKVTKTTTRESSRTETMKEPVLYVFRGSEAPWLLASQLLRYEGLGPDLQVSKTANFEVLVRLLRERMPTVPFDTRLLQVRPATTVTNAGAKNLTMSSAQPLDILAHVIASSLNQQARPYR
jgi:hypothetical protein